MPENQNELEFQDLVKKYSTSGLFTHAFAATGKLDSDGDTYSFSLAPESRDIFDLASMTKGLVTTPLVFNEVDKGLDLSASVKTTISEKQTTDLSSKILELKIKSLLSHRSGLPSWRNFYVDCVATAKPTPADLDLRLLVGLNRAAEELDPLKKETYSDLGFLLLGLILKRRTGKTLAQQFSSFYPNAGDIGYPESIFNLAKRAVPTSFCTIRNKKLCGEVHDENSAALGGVTGHAGLFGSGEAVCRYLKFLARSKAGEKMLQENMEAAKDSKNINLLMGLWRGSDFTDGKTGSFAIGHAGFTGTAFWISLPRRTYGVLLTNRVISGRRPGNDIKKFRKEAFNLLFKMSAV